METTIRNDKAHSASGYAMRECPVCHAVSFADMEVCYGCLHPFAKNEAPRMAEPIPAIVQDVPAPAPVNAPEAPVAETPVPAACEAAEHAQARVRLNEVLELVISIQVAQDALTRANEQVRG